MVLAVLMENSMANTAGVLFLEVKKHASVRKMEWGMTGFLGQLGLILMLPGDTFALSQSYAVLASKYDETTLGAVMFGFSILRFLVLLVNGTKLKNSAELRAILSFVSFAMMFSWAWDMSMAASVSSTGLAAYGWFAIFELMNVWQASADQKSRKAARASRGIATNGPERHTH